MSISRYRMYQGVRGAGKSLTSLHNVRVIVTDKYGNTESYEAVLELDTREVTAEETIAKINGGYSKRAEEDPDFGTVTLKLVQSSREKIAQFIDDMAHHPASASQSLASCVGYEYRKSVNYHNNDWRRKGRGFNGYRGR